MRLIDLMKMQEQFAEAFHDARAWRESPAAGLSFVPATDVSRTAEEYFVRCDLPGVSREDVRVYAEDGAIILSGTSAKTAPDDARVIRAERLSGAFSRVVPLPSDADLDSVSAAMRHGVLEVKVGRKQAQQPGRIQVEIQEAGDDG